MNIDGKLIESLVAENIFDFANLVNKRIQDNYDGKIGSKWTGDVFPHELREYIHIEEARKYYKLWWVRDYKGHKHIVNVLNGGPNKVTKYSNKRNFTGVVSSIHSFVDKATGNIYKPASTKAPAKHARGNILSEKNGAEALCPYRYEVRYL